MARRRRLGVGSGRKAGEARERRVRKRRKEWGAFLLTSTSFALSGGSELPRSRPYAHHAQCALGTFRTLTCEWTMLSAHVFHYAGPKTRTRGGYSPPRDKFDLQRSDWICDACSAVSFVRRLQCYQCGADKPRNPQYSLVVRHGEVCRFPLQVFGPKLQSRAQRFLSVNQLLCCPRQLRQVWTDPSYSPRALQREQKRAPSSMHSVFTAPCARSASCATAAPGTHAALLLSNSTRLRPLTPPYAHHMPIRPWHRTGMLPSTLLLALDATPLALRAGGCQ